MIYELSVKHDLRYKEKNKGDCWFFFQSIDAL